MFGPFLFRVGRVHDSRGVEWGAHKNFFFFPVSDGRYDVFSLAVYRIFYYALDARYLSSSKTMAMLQLPLVFGRYCVSLAVFCVAHLADVLCRWPCEQVQHAPAATLSRVACPPGCVSVFLRGSCARRPRQVIRRSFGRWGTGSVAITMHEVISLALSKFVAPARHPHGCFS